MTGAESEARFGCAVCGQLAGRVRLLSGGEQWTDRSRRSLEALAEVDAVASAIAAEDASALYSLAYSYAPFCCPECVASYCGEHWAWRRFEDRDIIGIEGNCPQGHFHVLCY